MMQAVINATDEGTRLRPLSCEKNPFLLPILGKTIIERLIELAQKHGVKDVIIIEGYMGEKLRESIGEGNEELTIRYVKGVYSDGALKIYSDILQDEFFYFSRPVCTDINLTKMYDYHRRKGAFATCVTEKGVMEGIVSDKGGCVTAVGEPRLWSRLSTGTNGTGIYLLKKDIVRFIPEESSVTIGENILPSLIRSGKNIYTYNETQIEVINDIASYVRANMLCLEKIPDSIEIREGATVEKGALLEKPCYIGKNAHIHKGAKIGSGSVIGDNSVVLCGADIKRSILGEDCRVEKGVSLRGCIADQSVRIEENASVYEQAILGFGSTIGKNSTIKSFVKIWPEKEVGEGMIVTENIMWGQKRRSKMLDKGEIKGVINVDITPSFATKVGECVGFVSCLGEVGISTDGSPSAQMLKDGIVSGLMGQGALVKDFGEQPLPITRRAVMFYMLNYGIFINTYEHKGEEWAEICLMGKDGIDIDIETSARLEKLYSEGGFMYPEATSIKEAEYHFEYKLHYLKELVKTHAITKTGIKILLACPAPWGRRLVMSALADMKVQVSMYRWKDEEESERHFEASVEEGGFDIGFITDSKCEKLSVVLPLWGVIDEHVYEVMCALVIMLKHKGATLFVPADASSSIEDMAQQHGALVVRTKSSPREMMRHLSGNEDYLTEQFIYRYDAIGSIIKLVEFVLSKRTTLNTLLDKIPKISMAKTKLSMTKDEISRAMESVMNISRAELDKTEGVKITFDKGWVMVIPDRYKEVCRVVSEGVNTEAAKELCDFCVEEIKRKL